jgi:hypothetical protein
MGLLANVDASILKMDFGERFEVKFMPNSEALSFFSKLENVPFPRIASDLGLHHHCLTNEGIFYLSKITVFEDVDSEDEDYVETAFFREIMKHDQMIYEEIEPELRLMRLYKEGNICMPVRFHISYSNGAPGTKLIGRTNDHVEFQKYVLDDVEIPELKRFVEDTRLPFELGYLEFAFSNFEQSYEVSKYDLAFLSLMTGMEALFNPGGSEITYRISRNAAVLIGKDKEDSEKVFKRMKDLYGKRSQIVHMGRPHAVQPEDILEMRDYLRRSIKEVYKINKEKDDLLKMLDAAGFGDKPWKDEAAKTIVI